MRIGQQYEMQRGPTYRTRRVTLLDKNAPSGRSHWVLVRIEDGISAEKIKEVPSQSLRHLSGTKPPQRRKARKPKQPERQAPPGWMPERGEAVAWTQTLGSRCTVLSVDPQRGVAQIEGVVMGTTQEFDAPVSELSPYEEPELVVHDGDIEDRLGNRLPKIRAPESACRSNPAPAPVEENEQEGWIERLIFSPGCISFYRGCFAKGASLQEAERRLRDELRGAEKLRKRHTGEYLRLRVLGRFDAVLKQSPSSGEFQALYVDGLQLPARRKRKKTVKQKAA